MFENFMSIGIYLCASATTCKRKTIRWQWKTFFQQCNNVVLPFTSYFAVQAMRVIKLFFLPLINWPVSYRKTNLAFCVCCANAMDSHFVICNTNANKFRRVNVQVHFRLNYLPYQTVCTNISLNFTPYFGGKL